MAIKNALQPVTIASILAEGTALLARHGVETSSLDAERLTAHCLQTTRLDLYKRKTETLTGSQEAWIRSVFERRSKREPLQYILGVQEFWSHEFITPSGVFIPRPETENLIEEALAWLSGREDAKKPATILDLCTGSGCISVTLAQQVASARLIAIDRSSRALEAARANARKHGLEDRMSFFCGDLFEPLAALELEGRIDLILSNPPYIPTGMIQSLQCEVSLYEPREALDGGADGMEIVRRIILQAPRYLSWGGRLLLEIGDQQAAQLAGWFTENFPEASIEFRPDLAGIQRVACINFSGDGGN